ncbi:hypothetical protein [Deinococcus roseus]|uniref:Shikimate dehydrogenase n=1 Tax=Deinococcus roseus TaxID=392414 RepID=A0ABQ2CVL9_9DEIO|nr:hypothetical protein [Deinococcus roseus]GGJ25390.1 hypothetical protein GCM10008938_09240 [Deinococcus roseus]
MNTFAFLAYPREISQDLAKLTHLPALKLIPDAAYEYAMRKFPIRPVLTGHLQTSQHPVRGHVISVPLTANHLKSLPAEEVHAKISEAISHARDLGASMIGLGALTAEVSGAGKAFQSRKDISITSGAAYRAASIVLEIERLLKHLPRKPTITLVGSDVVLASALLPVIQKIHGIHQVTVDPEPTPMKLREADLLVLLGDTSNLQIRSEHLKYNAMVLNASRGRAMDPRISRDRSDVIVTDPSIFNPAIRIQSIPGYSKTLCPSLTETILLSLEGHRGHFALGGPDSAQIEQLLLLLKKHQNLHFDFVPRQVRPARTTQLQGSAGWI